MSERCATVVEQLCRLNPFAGAEGLADPPRPDESSIPRHIPAVEQIAHIQKLLDTLSYNHLPRTIFNLEKHRSLQSVLMTAREILTEALPIRCLEATFVSLLLTQDLKDIDRIPLSFKSQANGNTFRHIVLGIRAQTPTGTCYGALGLSRKPTLMFKPMTFTSLYDVVMDYRREYLALGHELVDIKLGLAANHDSTSRFYPCWRYVALRLADYLDAPASPCTPGAPDEALRGKRPDAGAARAAHCHEPFSDEAANEEASASLSGPTTAALTHAADEETSAHGDASGVSGTPVANRGEEAAPGPSHPPANALEAFLRQYTRLLTTITDQHNKGIQSADGASQSVRLCFLDLDLADRNVAAENRRRVELIHNGQSPLSQESRRAAANRQLKPSSKGTGRSASRRAGATVVRANGTQPPPTKRRTPAAKSAASKRTGGPAPKRGSPGTRAMGDADGISCALKGGLLSPNTPAQNYAATPKFPPLPSGAHAAPGGDHAPMDDVRSDGSRSEHALSRHDSVDSELFSSLDGSEPGGDLME